MDHEDRVAAREAGLAHRRAIAKRFADLAAVGQAVFLTGAPIGLELPHTVEDGERCSFAGFNRWMLLQVMQDQGWRDARFFTRQQVLEAGWKLNAEARPVILQQVTAVDASGELLAVPEVDRVPVFNAEHIDGVPAPSDAHKRSAAALYAALASEGFEPGAGVGPSLAAWLSELYREQGGDGTASSQVLARSLAMTALATDIDWGVDGTAATQAEIAHWAGGGWSEQISTLLADDPMALFDAVRIADAIVGQAMSLVRIADQEMGGERELQKARMEAVGGEQDPQHASLNEVTMSEDRSARLPRAGQPLPGRSYSARVEEMFAEREAVLAVPYRDKDRAQALGAVWYKPQMVWFVPNGIDRALFKEWDPREHCLGQTAAVSEVIAHFREAMEDMGLDASKDIQADGKWHNVPVPANKGMNRSGAYVLDLEGGEDRTPKGFINNKYSGEERAWRFDGPLLTLEQKARLREEAVRRAREADQAAQQHQASAAKHAAEIVAQAVPADGHPYLRKKGVPAEGVLQVHGRVLLGYDEFYGETGRSAIRDDQWYLIVPMRDMAGQLRAVQAISEDGSIKSFMRGAQKKGTMAILGAPSFDALCASASAEGACALAVGFVEGFATAASFRQPTGLPVVVCFDAGNLETVAAEAARKLPASMRPVIGVDNDQFFVERALGFLAEHVGVNPNSQRGSVVEVLSGRSNARLVSLGDAVADGGWHQAPRGRYRMSVEREADSTEVRQIALETHQEGAARPSRMLFSNRGLEAGRVALQAFAGPNVDQAGPTASRAVMLVPEFKKLDRRPTDWNDLAASEGLYAVARQVLTPLGLDKGRGRAQSARESRPPARSVAGPQR